MDAFTLSSSILVCKFVYEQEATNDIYIWSGFAMLNSVRTGLPDIFQDSFWTHFPREGLPCEHDKHACQNFQKQSQKVTNMGVAPAYLTPKS